MTTYSDKASGTKYGYDRDFRLFVAWCYDNKIDDALHASPENVASYFEYLAKEGLLSPTIHRRCSAICYFQKKANGISSTNSAVVAKTLISIRRMVGALSRHKTPVLEDKIRAMADIAVSIGGLKGLRDRALLLLCFAGAFRRSELVALDFADLEFTDKGISIKIRRSKTDQEGKGDTKGIARGAKHCSVDAVEAWIKAAHITKGAIFRPVRKGGAVRDRRLSAKAVCDLVKAYAGKVGLNIADIGAHSLRSGVLTSAARRGVPIHKLQQLSGHKSIGGVASYIHDAELFENHATKGML